MDKTERHDGIKSELPHNLKEFLQYYWNLDRKQWILFFCQDLVHFTRYSIAFVIVGKIVDILTRSELQYGVPPEALLLAVSIFFVLGCGEASHVWTAYTIQKWKPRLRARIRRDFFNYVLGHSHTYYQNHFAGALARKVTEIAESSFRLHDHLRFAIGGSLIAMMAATMALLSVSPFYGFLLVLFIASVTAPVFLRLKKISHRSREFSEIRAGVTGTIVDILTNATAMRNFARTSYEREKHEVTTNAEQRADQRRLLTMIQIENYRRLSFVVLGGGMMLALLNGWEAGRVSVGEIATVMGLSFSLISSTWMFGFGVVMTADELGYIDDAIRMITPTHGVQDKPGAQPLTVKEGRISFERVSFNFPGQTVFEDLNLVIEPGQKVGLVGPSGAGKSTLMNLIMRQYDVDEGKVLVDGVDLRDVTQESLRAAIAIIPQDTALFHRSLADNIRYGRLDATEAEIIEAANLAYAGGFIAKLPQGYATMVGERGVKLSGGQRQRIAIARAMLKNAPILLLDEATSALDSESEKMIQDSLKHLMQGKTVIAIAHRLSTIATMDRLVVMDQGRIVEEGTHQYLLGNNGLYARLWAMQSGGFIGE
jgi:ABC-type multidrug transport system fused ATPase/permease subunit